MPTSACVSGSACHSQQPCLFCCYGAGAHHRGQDGLPTLAPGRTCTGIEPETVASFPSYRYKAEGGHSVTARAASTRQSKQAAVEEDAEVLIGSRRASEPVLPSPRLAANSAADPIK